VTHAVNASEMNVDPSDTAVRESTVATRHAVIANAVCGTSPR
jgi:hypothetical protein